MTRSTFSTPLCAIFLTAMLILPSVARADAGILLSFVEQMEAGYAKVQDYTATFLKQERVNQKLLDKELIAIKFQKPFKVYMKWLETAHKEALYVHGQYDNKVLARADGLLGLWTWTFKPTDPRLMDGNRHPVTDIGFGFIIEMMRRDIPVAIERGEVTLVKVEDESFDGRPATRLDALFAPKDGRKYYTTRIICYMDKEHKLPIGIQCYDEKGQLEEQYGYKDLKVNVGLTAMDFSKENKEYRFERGKDSKEAEAAKADSGAAGNG